MNFVNGKALIITGPTASGKTSLSEDLANRLDIDIVNSDMGQFYKQLSVGTAKPDFTLYKNQPHLFNVIDGPLDVNVVEFRKMVESAVENIWARRHLPLLVGGSLFYIKSLFFPPSDLSKVVCKQIYSEDSDLWALLNSIDSDRARELNPNDIYRIKRALDIWYSTQKKPSQFKPQFAPLFKKTIIIFTCPPREILRERIIFRTKQMIEQGGWIDEVRPLVGTEWETFFKLKGLIGYTEVIEWIKAGEKESDLSSTIQKIQDLTCQYAKRQITFWQSFKKQIQPFNDLIDIIEISNCEADAMHLVNAIQEFFQK